MSVTFHTDGAHLNVSNSNAAALLELLGLPGEPDGDRPADDMRGGVHIAQALVETASADRQGLPAAVDGRWVDAGRRPGYLADRLTTLADLATRASRHGGWVCWS